MPDYFIGLMSGTSMDGIDAIVVRFGKQDAQLLASLEQPYPEPLRRKLLQAMRDPESCSVDDVGTLDRQVGESFRDAALAVLAGTDLVASDIAAIGSHGQTLRHRPDAPTPYSLQIGDPATIAVGTGITTVADFRRADIAAGGQGAPLVPPFHQWLFGRSGSSRVILNIGGIANITVLGEGNKEPLGFDTGPGNTLLDGWIQANQNKRYDREGAWATSGRVEPALLQALLVDDYFRLAPPKSTGFEHFNLEWLRQRGADNHAPADVQATLAELSARTIAAAIEEHAATAREVLVCGGGFHNNDLLRRLGQNLPGRTVSSTAAEGLHPDWVEATAFAWLAMRTLNKQSGNLPSVTGASRKLVLGAIHSP
ncbi:MAG: anhydro-N-acetylmuramic acid kinase [Woeseiaceae bacterium]